jgi:hypothetical protein
MVLSAVIPGRWSLYHQEEGHLPRQWKTHAHVQTDSNETSGEVMHPRRDFGDKDTIANNTNYATDNNI